MDAGTKIGCGAADAAGIESRFKKKERVES